MKLEHILKPSRMLTAQIASLSILIGIGAVVSPFIIRSVIDGFLISHDRMALIFSLFIVATFEAVSFGADFIIRNKLNALVQVTLSHLKAVTLNSFLSRRVQPDLEFFNRTWSIDIRRVVHHDMRQRWLRYKDIFLVAVMSFVIMNLSAQAGIFIIVIAALQFSLAAWDSKSNREDVYSIRQAEELEYQNLKNFLVQLPELYDQDRTGNEVKKMQALVEHAGQKQNLADRNRSFLWDLKVISRGLLIMGALAIAAFGGIDMSWAAGTFWALMMVIFKLSNPINSLAQWVFSERAVQSSRARVVDLLNCFSDDAVQSSQPFLQFKNSIGKHLLQSAKDKNPSKKVQVLLKASELETFKQVARQWSSRFLWGQVQILSNPFDLPSKVCSHVVYIIDSQHLSEINTNRILAAAPQVCILTSVPLPELLFDKNFIWMNEQEKFLELDHEKKFLPQLTEIVKNQSVDWKEAFRDLRMYCKLKVPFEVLLIKWDTIVEKSKIVSVVRDVDHVIMGPDGLAVILLIGSDGAGSQCVLDRMNKAMAAQGRMLNRHFINAHRDNWQTTLGQVEENLTVAMYYSKQIENEAVA